MSLNVKDRPSGAALGFIEFVCLMAVMTSLVALSIDAMLPAMSQIGLASLFAHYAIIYDLSCGYQSVICTSLYLDLCVD